MSLKEKFDKNNFLIGVELTSSRGIISENKIQKTIDFGNELLETNEIDWISITDNAGGNPTLRPTTLADSFLNKGKEIIIHLTCKDLNRNGLESTAWSLASKGFENILALTGDYPQKGFNGGTKPVFDLDSVTLLNLLSAMNTGLETGIKKKSILNKTDFFLGASVSNYKKNENELVPQYLKLINKIKNGASFIIPQVGFDAKKMHELKLFMIDNGYADIPLVGNIYLLTKFTANLFNKNRIPGIVLTDELLQKCMKAAQYPDKGKSFFIEFAAKMLAVYRGLGYEGAYFGGLHNINDTKRILEIEKTFAAGDWKEFAKDISFSQKDEYFLYKTDKNTGLLTNEPSSQTKKHQKLSIKSRINYSISNAFHKLMFTPKSLGFKIGKKISDEKQYKYHIPSWIHSIEKHSKNILYDCQDCGDCALQYTAYLCPESQCPKNLRNGPCGGSHQSICEVKEQACIWTRSYDRLKNKGKEKELLSHSPAFKDNDLKSTSGWANYWLGIDFGSKLNNTKKENNHERNNSNR